MSKNTVLVMKNGRKISVTGETSRYWLCKNTQYRKSSRSIEKVTESSEVKPKKAKEE